MKQRDYSFRFGFYHEENETEILLYVWLAPTLLSGIKLVLPNTQYPRPMYLISEEQF